MSFIKKNLIFFIVVLICGGAFAAGAYLAFAQSGNVKKSERSLSSAEAQLTSLRSKTPALTEENVEAAEQNVAELKAALADIRENLQQGAALKISEDGVSVIAGIQQYISRFQRRVDKRSDESGELPPIKTPNNFAFGFDQYLNDAPIPDDSGIVATLDQQRQILSYLLTRLIAANPESIDKVQREILEDTQNSNSSKTFAINKAISARVPGAVDTMAFSLTFSGYTYALRDFLNSLAQFELPIVVRDIKVVRPSGSETVMAPTRGSEATIFDLFRDGGNQATTATEEWPKAVIEDNISQFTIILEFIEVVLPDTQNQEAS